MVKKYPHNVKVKADSKEEEEIEGDKGEKSRRQHLIERSNASLALPAATSSRTRPSETRRAVCSLNIDFF